MRQSSSRRLDFSNMIPSHILQNIAVDVVFPYMLYQFISARLHAPLALALVALLPAGYMLWQFNRQRILDLIGVLSLYVLLWIFISDFIQNGSTLLLVGLSVSLPIAILGILTLLTRFLPMPLFFYVDRYCHTQTADHMADYTDYWHESATYRQMIRHINTIWGWTQIGFAILLLALAYFLADVFSSAVLLVTVCIFYIALTVWTVQHEGSHDEITEA
ncbi:hypothetical protein KDW_24140 [Dictyobacter vulcani]|uniref:Uncharacterized protein n=1 Tax=Dictyobacter vulcani TaxID=2607529 RepID=A0A5J4KM88_9CHLR|nr:VC0807 family protein [Dictyobacter vulcani]GER88252.1 hypothetical protein KDW_24140 [Dictyobacter vulcani]